MIIRQHSGVGQNYPKPTETCISGVCTGALSAAAVSCCKHELELLPLAVQTVAIAFRVGLKTVRARNGISSSSEPWSLVVSSSSAESVLETLKNFSEANVSTIYLCYNLIPSSDMLQCLPLTSQPYVSAYGLHGQTISAPPSILKQLQNTYQFGHTGKASIPIHAPYHAPHLFDEKDIDHILEPIAPLLSSNTYGSNLPFISSATGKLIQVGSIRLYFESALRQILIEPFHFQKLCEGISQHIQASDAKSFQIIPFGSTADKAVASALQSICREYADHTKEPLRNVNILDNPDVRSSNSKIAIIGISGRYPSAENNEEFWDLLFNGLDVHKPAPALHWDVKTHVDHTGAQKNTSATPYGCWLEHPDAFDAQFFNMSPREAPQVDPAQRIALMTAYEAIEQAGIVPDSTPSTRKDRVGVFYGVTSNDWMETNSAQNIDTYFIPGGNRAFIPGRFVIV